MIENDADQAKFSNCFWYFQFWSIVIASTINHAIKGTTDAIDSNRQLTDCYMLIEYLRNTLSNDHSLRYHFHCATILI